MIVDNLQLNSWTEPEDGAEGEHSHLDTRIFRVGDRIRIGDSVSCTITKIDNITTRLDIKGVGEPFWVTTRFLQSKRVKKIS